jgi:hypothetical protein
VTGGADEQHTLARREHAGEILRRDADGKSYSVKYCCIVSRRPALSATIATLCAEDAAHSA